MFVKSGKLYWALMIEWVGCAMDEWTIPQEEGCILEVKEKKMVINSVLDVMKGSI